jgi:hypothetical protein
LPLAVDNCAAVDNCVGQEVAELAEPDDAEAVLASEEGFDSDDLELGLSCELTSDFPFALGLSELLERLSVR